MLWIHIWAIIKIIHGFVNLWVGLLKCIIPKAMSEEYLETFCKSTKQFLALLVSSGYTSLAGCSQSSQTVHQLPMRFQVQIQMEFSAICLNNTSFRLHSSLHLCRSDQPLFFICYYLKVSLLLLLSNPLYVLPPACWTLSYVAELFSRTSF